MPKPYRYFVTYARRLGPCNPVIDNNQVTVHRPIRSLEDIRGIERVIHEAECLNFHTQSYDAGDDSPRGPEPEAYPDLVIRVLHFQLFDDA